MLLIDKGPAYLIDRSTPKAPPLLVEVTAFARGELPPEREGERRVKLARHRAFGFHRSGRARYGAAYLIRPDQLQAELDARAALEARYAFFRASTAHGKAVQAQIRPAWDNMISKLFMADAAGFELARSQVVEALQAVRLDWPVLPR